MYDASMLRCVTLDDVIMSKCPPMSLRNHGTRPNSMCNSAPSRLEHLDDLIDDGEFLAPDKLGSKSNSLSSLFRKLPHRDSMERRDLSDTDLCRFTEVMSVPSNSPVDSDNSAPPSPLEKDPLRNGFFPPPGCNPDRNNNEESEECDSSSQTSSTSLEPSDASSCFFGVSISAATSDCEAHCFSWRRLIRRDTLSSIEPEVRSLTESNNDSGVVISDTSECCVDAMDPTSGECEDDQESISSISSEDTFVGDDVMEERPVVVYRSLSDSTVHRSCRKEVSETVKRRKSVHFADSRGYDLETHISFTKNDDYLIPPRLMEALGRLRAESETKDDCFLFTERSSYNSVFPQRDLVLTFQQPFLEATFRNRVDQQNVCLESISVLPNSMSFTGVARVVNLEYEKKVFVRYSVDRWRTYVDVPACYVSSLVDFRHDQFSFHVSVPDAVLHTSKVELAICYQLPRTKREFWDNNYCRNYVIKCFEHFSSS